MTCSGDCSGCGSEEVTNEIKCQLDVVSTVLEQNGDQIKDVMTKLLNLCYDNKAIDRMLFVHMCTEFVKSGDPVYVSVTKADSILAYAKER